AAVELQVAAIAIAGPRVLDRLGGNIDTADVFGNAGQQVGTITFAAGRIENALASRHGKGERIAVPVFIADLAHALRREALAGELQRLVLLSHRGLRWTDSSDAAAAPGRTRAIRRERSGRARACRTAAILRYPWCECAPGNCPARV